MEAETVFDVQCIGEEREKNWATPQISLKAEFAASRGRSNRDFDGTLEIALRVKGTVRETFTQE